MIRITNWEEPSNKDFKKITLKNPMYVHHFYNGLIIMIYHSKKKKFRQQLLPSFLSLVLIQVYVFLKVFI